MMNKVYLVAGLAYGDEGKGAVVDFLARQNEGKSGNVIIVRYNGGPQAAHNVITPDGRHHTFSQFGSGMFVPGSYTYLSEHMLINPLNMMAEEEHLRVVGITNAWDRTIVHDGAVLVTPYHVAMNRMIENYRGNDKHGSCGQGIGIARQLHIAHPTKVPLISDINRPNLLKEKLEYVRQIGIEMVEMFAGKVTREEAIITNPKSVPYFIEQYQNWPARNMLVQQHWINDILKYGEGITIFEGAQGMMIDEVHGQAPHNTWTDCTFGNAEKILKLAGFGGKVVKIGVVRTYYTRHGEGPFTEDEQLQKVFSAQGHKEMHNGTNQYQGRFKIGRFDPERFGYALDKIGGVDVVALNHIDAPQSNQLIEKLNESGKVGMIGWGPTAEQRHITLPDLF